MYTKRLNVLKCSYSCASFSRATWRRKHKCCMGIKKYATIAKRWWLFHHHFSRTLTCTCRGMCKWESSSPLRRFPKHLLKGRVSWLLPAPRVGSLQPGFFLFCGRWWAKGRSEDFLSLNPGGVAARGINPRCDRPEQLALTCALSAPQRRALFSSSEVLLCATVEKRACWCESARGVKRGRHSRGKDQLMVLTSLWIYFSSRGCLSEL